VAQASSERAANSASEQAASYATVTLPDAVDLHARPAADFVRTAMGFKAAIQVAANGREADAKSLLTVLALGAKGGTELRLTAEGEDANAALDALRDRVATLA
jgi:phosphotransferase system HPr (HPr) family protein